MALSMNAADANADEVENKKENEKKSDKTLDLGEYQESTYKTAVVKDGVAVKDKRRWRCSNMLLIQVMNLKL